MADTLKRPVRRLKRFWRALHRRVRIAIVFVLVLALAALGFFVWARVTHCGPDVERVDGQCVGITDGTNGHVFGDATGRALDLIGEENTRIAGDPSAVSIAYVVPIPPPGVDDDYATRLAGDIMGVAVAQRQANRTSTVGGPPPIRVLIANIGESGQPSAEPITRLRDMATTGFNQYRLMAVAISGKSLAPLTVAIDTLLTADVPVVISHLTADRLTSLPVTADTALARVAPTTSDEAAAAAAYLRSTGARRTLIVQNTDPEDAYSQDLGKAFRERYPGNGFEIVAPDEPYNGHRKGAANTMPHIVNNLCGQQPPDALFFAGRAPELAELIAAMPYRRCLDRPITVMTGDDGASLAAAVATGSPEVRAGLAANISVAYTALAHPEAWRQAAGAFQPHSADYLTGNAPEAFPTLFPGQSLDDGYAIMAYDAIMTVVRSIRSSQTPLDSPDALIQEFKRIHGIAALPGASGWISLSPTGNTQDKAVPILGIGADGRAKFLQLSSPSGAPCTRGMPQC